ncbi:hypothetical protein BHM03_00060628 [Ensete ventricosum]|nr:hypothetical protein BHM03_00060628 [Ensete ventricosum]
MVLADSGLHAWELERCLTEACEEIDSRLHELDLELNLTLRRVEEVKAQAEEACDEAAITKDMAAMAAKSATECAQKLETLRRELKDAYW